MHKLPNNSQSYHRPTWHEYFLMLAKLAATRSTCLAFPVGAVIVKNKQILATGYNGPPSGSAHCTAQGYCYPELSSCDASKIWITVPFFCGQSVRCFDKGSKKWAFQQALNNFYKYYR